MKEIINVLFLKEGNQMEEIKRSPIMEQMLDVDKDFRKRLSEVYDGFVKR